MVLLFTLLYKLVFNDFDCMEAKGTAATLKQSHPTQPNSNNFNYCIPFCDHTLLRNLTFQILSWKYMLSNNTLQFSTLFWLGIKRQNESCYRLKRTTIVLKYDTRSCLSSRNVLLHIKVHFSRPTFFNEYTSSSQSCSAHCLEMCVKEIVILSSISCMDYLMIWEIDFMRYFCHPYPNRKITLKIITLPLTAHICFVFHLYTIFLNTNHAEL